MTQRTLVDDLRWLLGMYGIEGDLVEIHAEGNTVRVTTCNRGPFGVAVQYRDTDLPARMTLPSTLGGDTPIHDEVADQQEARRHYPGSVLDLRDSINRTWAQFWAVTGRGAR